MYLLKLKSLQVEMKDLAQDGIMIVMVMKVSAIDVNLMAITNAFLYDQMDPLIGRPKLKTLNFKEHVKIGAQDAEYRIITSQKNETISKINGRTS